MTNVFLRGAARDALSPLVVVLALHGCAANLVVNNTTVTWNDTIKVASADVANVGNLAAGEFLVYFDADENPVSQNHRPQVQHRVTGLAPGGAVTLTADFSPLAHIDNANLGNVYQIKVIADPKGAVAEDREDDNVVVVPLPPPVCAAGSSDVASGTTGSIIAGQSFNETRAVNVTVLGSSDRLVQKLLLKGLNLGATATVGARIYDDASHALIGSSNVTVAGGMNQLVEVPVTATLTAGTSYRIGFYVETSLPSQGSGDFFIPGGFTSPTSETPYSETSGVFRINSAHAIASDAFPANPNMAVLQMTIFTVCP